MATEVSSVSDALFSSTYTTQQSLDNLSQSALSRGIELYGNGDYEGAVKEFKRSIGLSPTSEYMVDTSNYLANAYLQLNDTENAISTYEKCIKLNPTRDDVHITLGNLYFQLNRFKDSENEYQEAVRINPSANNYYSLGQAYMSNDLLDDAKTVFQKVKTMAQNSAMGDYGLGQVYSKLKQYDKAIEHFERAIGRNDELYDAYAEMGYVYADMGNKDEAKKIKEFLYEKDASLASNLSAYIAGVGKPAFTAVYYPEGFGSYPAKTPVSAMSSYLENADSSKTFTIKIYFSKEMDRASVEDLANWRISRADGTGAGEAYNFGLDIPSTEVSIPSIPINVYYDDNAWSATVRFRVKQNSTADGTIDPSHIQFEFKGEDLYGLSMDTAADEFNSFSGVA